MKTLVLLLIASTIFCDQICSQTYQVNSGDTLSNIAKKFNVSMEDILATNPLIADPAKIFAEQIINIPPCSEQDFLPNENNNNTYNNNSNNINNNNNNNNNFQDNDVQNDNFTRFDSVENLNCQKNYVVKQGDTLNQISVKFEVSIDEILRVNPEIQNPDLIFVGQIIKIPPCQEKQQFSNFSPESEDIISVKEFSREVFLECGGFVDTFDALMEAMEELEVSFQTDEEAAMFMAQIRHEGTTNPTKTSEFCSTETPPCNNNYNTPCSWRPKIQPVPGQYYYGRGPIQLTWVCNYEAAGKFLGLDLAQNPDQIIQNDVVAWKTALWYWFFSSKKSPSKAARNINFSGTTKAINPMECGNQERQRQRVENYMQISTCMGLKYTSKLYC